MLEVVVNPFVGAPVPVISIERVKEFKATVPLKGWPIKRKALYAPLTYTCWVTLVAFTIAPVEGKVAMLAVPVVSDCRVTDLPLKLKVAPLAITSLAVGASVSNPLLNETPLPVLL